MRRAAIEEFGHVASKEISTGPVPVESQLVSYKQRGGAPCSPPGSSRVNMKELTSKKKKIKKTKKIKREKKK